jgi:hypothetical protein
MPEPGSRSINIPHGHNFVGQFITGDHNVTISEQISVGVDAKAFTSFVELMLRTMPELRLSADQEAGARQALDEVRQEVVASGDSTSPVGVQRAMRSFVGYLSQAGQPALTAAFMTLAMHLGAIGSQ